MLIETLEWDSKFFKKKVGKLIVSKGNEFDSVQFHSLAKPYFDLIYVFSKDQPLKQDCVFNSNLDLVDIIARMSKPFSPNALKKYEISFRNTLNHQELLDCYEIAEQTAKVSRFFQEPLIGLEKTKAMYRKWIDNSLNRSFSDGIFIKKEAGKVVGFHIIKTDVENKIGYFTLTAVHESFIGKGLGKVLWENSYNYWSQSYNIQKVISSFSMKNRESLNFHLKMDFKKFEELNYIYHFRNFTKE